MINNIKKNNIIILKKNVGQVKQGTNVISKINNYISS